MECYDEKENSQLFSLHIASDNEASQQQQLNNSSSQITVHTPKRSSHQYSTSHTFNIIKAISKIIQKLSFYENLKQQILEKDTKILDANFRIQQKLSCMVNTQQADFQYNLFQQLTEQAKDCELLMNEISLHFIKMIQLFTNFDSDSLQNSPSIKLPELKQKYPQSIIDQYYSYFQSHSQYLSQQIKKKNKILAYYREVIFHLPPQRQSTKNAEIQSLIMQRDQLRNTVKQWQKICDQYLQISAQSKNKVIAYQRLFKEKLGGFKQQLDSIRKNQKAIQQDIEQYILNQLEQFTQLNKGKVNGLINQITSVLQCHKSDIIKQIKILQSKSINTIKNTNIQQQSFQITIENNPEFNNCQHLIEQSLLQSVNEVENFSKKEVHPNVQQKQQQIKIILQHLQKLENEFKAVQVNSRRSQRKMQKLQREIQLKNQSIQCYENQNQYLLHKIFGHINKWNQFWQKNPQLQKIKMNNKQQVKFQVNLQINKQLVQTEKTQSQTKLSALKARPFIKKSKNCIKN